MVNSAWFKSTTADKVLSPVRQRLLEMIEPGSTVLDVGCGTGDLLFKASNKIKFDLGVDLDPVMVDLETTGKVGM
ncbi:MAG: class I SAM-dependent methyltransferase [Gammaproteobacteria bacterium]